MFKKVVLHNFQGHKDTEIELDPVITALVGTSRAGKSSVLRALRWLFYNSPSAGKPSHWVESKDDSSVSIEEDSTTITRIRGKAGNGYDMTGFSPFRAIGTKVPPQVASFLNLSDINFSGQHDAPFLLSKTPGEVGRYLNTLIDLDIIDEKLAKAASSKKEVATKLKFLKEDLAKKQAELSALSWVDSAQELYNTWDAQNKGITSLKKEQQALSVIVSSIADTRGKIGPLKQNIEAVGELVNQAKMLSDKIKQKQNRVSMIAGILGELEVIRRKQGVLDPETIDAARRLLLRYKALSDLHDKAKIKEKNLSFLINSLNQTKKGIDITKEIVKDCEEWFTSNGVCPTCGQSIKTGGKYELDCNR